MHPFLNIADQAARVAGQHIIHASKSLGRIKIYEKKDHSFSTDVDHAVEQLLIQHIHEAYPTHSIYSEEQGMISRDSDYLWIIDPLDGTNNFIHNLYSYSISIAIKKKERIEHALIYDPLAQETFVASHGQGTRLNQRRLRVNQKLSLQKSLIYLNSPSHHISSLERWSLLVKELVLEKSSIRCLGSVALGLAYVAAGRLDGFISCTSSKLWDIAAGTLMIQEAGGIVCDEKGTGNYLDTGKVIAGNPKLLECLIKINSKITSLT